MVRPAEHLQKKRSNRFKLVKPNMKPPIQEKQRDKFGKDDDFPMIVMKPRLNDAYLMVEKKMKKSPH